MQGIVELVAVAAGERGREVEVMPAQLSGETIDNIGLSAAEDDAVVAINLVVAIDVGLLQVAWLGCLSVDGGQF